MMDNYRIDGPLLNRSGQSPESGLLYQITLTSGQVVTNPRDFQDTNPYSEQCLPFLVPPTHPRESPWIPHLQP